MINKALQKLKQAYPLKTGNTHLEDFVETIKDKTNNFTNPRALSTEKIEVKNMLKQHEVNLSEWLKKYDVMELSEQDVVILMSKEIENKTSSSKVPELLMKELELLN